jgi:hypothetical protein
MAIASFAERDRQLAAMILDEIEKVREDQRRFGWSPNSSAWHRAFGKLAGLHTVLSLVEDCPRLSEADLAAHLNNTAAPPPS